MPLKNSIKSFVLDSPSLKRFYDKGYFNGAIRKQRIINFIFQRIFRINGNCPWSVHHTSQVVFPHRISIDTGVEKSFLLSGGCYVQGGNGISIGEGTVFGPGVKIVSANHNAKDLSTWEPAESIRIGKACWIGANAVILPGVEIGDSSIVGAGAVVTKSFPAKSVVAGNPAKTIKRIA